MRRFTAALSAVALVLVLAVTVSANTTTVTKATVTSAGLVSLYGTVSCPEGMQFQIGGDVTQILGSGKHKYIVNGQINGGGTCLADVTPWSVQLTANTNKFTTGSAVVNLNIQSGDPNGGFGDGTQLLVKLVRTK